MGLNEADTRAKLIDPAFHRIGWTEDLIRREITAGTIEIINRKTRRNSKILDEKSEEIMYLKNQIQTQLNAINQLSNSILNEVFGQYQIQLI